MRSRSHHRMLALAGVILAPALVLAFLSWRSLREEREARRAEVFRQASLAAEAALRRVEATLQGVLQDARGEAGATAAEAAAAGAKGILVAVRAGGRLLYPRPLEADPPGLEERLRREDPSLYPALAAALDLEFAQGEAAEAAIRYERLEGRAESASLRAALLNARARAAGRGARDLYERLAREHPDVASESGLPYRVVARAHLVELDPTLARVAALIDAFASAALPGHARAAILRDLARAETPVRDVLLGELPRARALDRLEESLDRPPFEVARIDGCGFLFAPLPLPDGEASMAVRLHDAPGAALHTADGFAFALEGLDPPPPGEVLVRRASAAHPALAVAVVLVDSSLLEVPAGRVALAGSLVACLVAALGFGVVAMLRTVRRELAVAQMKSDFVSGVSHELKTPLTSIRMFAEMLETGKAATDEKRREYHRLIHRESLRLSRLVENVLDFARVEEGRKTFDFQERPLREVVASATETFRALAESPSMTLDLAEEPLVARVDADALAGAVLNLLDNALKYGGGKIELRLARCGDAAEISVRDRGPGIPPGERERIFEKFVRGAAAARGPAGGAGLGLALVKHAVLAHGGSVRVESEPGKGSLFVLTLPLCPRSSS